MCRCFTVASDGEREDRALEGNGMVCSRQGQRPERAEHASLPVSYRRAPGQLTG